MSRLTRSGPALRWLGAFAPLIFAGSVLCAADARAAQAQDGLPCAYEDRKCAQRLTETHPVRQAAHWRSLLSKPLAERIGAAPPELVEYLSLDNIKNGYPDRPRAAAISADFLRDVHAAIAELPEAVKKPLASRLIGIYFIEDIGSTGFNDQVFDGAGNPVAGFIVLDPSRLRNQTANAWATWKENTPFQPKAGFTLVAEIAAKADDNRKNAIQYILLHELGHIFAIGSDVHPSWSMPPQDVTSVSAYPFFSLSWLVSKDRRQYVSRFEDVLPERRQVVYYFGAKLGAERMVSTYANLEKTNFATLYSVVNPFDDFAEAFVTYVHTVLLGKPLEIRIYENGTLAKQFEACWTQPRCAEKRTLIERVLGRR